MPWRSSARFEHRIARPRARDLRWPLGSRRAMRARSVDMSQVVRELDKLHVIERPHLLNHDRLVRAPRPALIITQGFQQGNPFAPLVRKRDVNAPADDLKHGPVGLARPK